MRTHSPKSPPTAYYVPAMAPNVSPVFRNRVLSGFELHKLRQSTAHLEYIVASYHKEATRAFLTAHEAKDKAYWWGRAIGLRRCANRYAARLEDHLNALNAVIEV